ncbi:hypothetical protein CA235_17085 [Sphingomonas sp. ABOLF]|uniref:hypothetical protein n=1 Tax=Sphingomonas sp. ABOLF TaxID=1985879 RepID=UPI00062D534D|nr:hypothetical protein [Sphingomonas sp. ABOLF]RSV12382.1 hypothetical protein CA235_17085 [Sphingomonas sp. ABOLF]
MFLWNVGKIFGHGLLSFTLGVIRFGFALGTVAGLIGMFVMGIKWLFLRQPEALAEVGLSLLIAFGCFAANVALATLQRRLRLALDRSIAGPQGASDTTADYPAPIAAAAPHGAFPAPMRAANDDRVHGGAGWR